MTIAITTESTSIVPALWKIHKKVLEMFSGKLPTEPVDVKINDDCFSISYHKNYHSFDLYDTETGELYAIIGFNPYGLYIIETIDITEL